MRAGLSKNQGPNIGGHFASKGRKIGGNFCPSKKIPGLVGKLLPLPRVGGWGKRFDMICLVAKVWQTERQLPSATLGRWWAMRWANRLL